MNSNTPATTTKRVGYLELFFDLVFVFAVTQLVTLLHNDHTAAGWGRAGIMMWLIWWAWSQYTWAGNAIDLDRRTTRIWILVATGTMLGAAAAIPTAFDEHGPWFAVPYAAVRLLGLALYWFGLRNDPAHRTALRTYVPIATISPLLILAGGIVDDTLRVTLWCLAILIDVVSVLAAGRGEFRVDAAHFAERHGLIVIIALGESVIAIGATATKIGLTGDVIALLAVAFVAVAGLWWTYFDWVHHAAEARLVHEPNHQRRSTLARDLFTLGHLPIVAGTVVFAAAIEEALLHPTEPLNTFALTALAAGPGLYLAGFVIGNLRASGRILRTRLVGLIAIITIAALAGPHVSALASTAAIAATIIAIAAIEGTTRRRPAYPYPTSQAHDLTSDTSGI
jgi:low temperature requirement protein LtrA